ncbi:MAG: DEAD/DEAH box helicase [Salaquimonas sp.]
MGYTEPTPIQREAIPLVMEGHDIMGLAQTGTGKTAAFGLPLVQQLMGAGSRPYPKTIRALILSPTRELANQIADNLKSYVKNTHLRVTTVVGGQSINVQQKALGRGNDVLVATPGRLLDLVERKAVILDSAKFLVLDEADQMLDLGFIHALKRISKLVAKERQTLLFSATMPKEIEGLAKAFLTDPVRIEVAPPGKAADKVSQSVYYVGQRAKADLLKTLLAERPDDLSLVFARTKHGAEKLMKGLVAEGFPAGSIHGNKSQGQRDRSIRDFKSGAIRILVATDVAARGIDISGVSHVYNFDLPEVPANYVHRIGRTARAGAEGLAVAFCAPEEAHLLSAIEKMMGMKVQVAGGTMTEADRKAGAQAAKEMRQGRGRGSRGGAGKGGGQASRSRNQPGARRGTPERTGGGKPSAKKQYADDGFGETSQDPQDDFAKVKAAGFSGKPNSKKNRKRFGNPSAEGQAQNNGGGRHSSGGRPAAAGTADAGSGKPNANKKRFGSNRSASFGDNNGGTPPANAQAKRGNATAPSRNSRPGKRPAGEFAAGRDGGQGRKRKPA